MTDHTGRNAPCPCGSGKKFKHCCLTRHQNSAAHMVDMRDEVSSADDRINGLLFDYFQKINEPATLDEAWNEFAFTDSGFPEDSPHLAVFQSWLFYNWTPPRKKRGPAPASLALDFLNRNAEHLSVFERQYLLATLEAHFSFWEVLSVDPGRGLRLKDVLVGTESDVREHTGSRFLKPGDMVFGRVILIDGNGFLNDAGPIPFPPRVKPQVIGLRSEIRKQDPRENSRVLSLWDFRIRKIYLDLHAQLTTTPLLVNFEGDPLEWHELIYDIESPIKAFDGLKTLGTARSSGDSLKKAIRDERGDIRIIELDWTKKLDPGRRAAKNTLFGRIRIEDKTLTVEVNSARRAQIIRAEIEKRLGPEAVYRGTRLRPSEDMM
ncbi:SEC-C domain-containing protein, partial [bacterium]|nr:SEC-C domain-containing protein [bacterium]